MTPAEHQQQPQNIAEGSLLWNKYFTELPDNAGYFPSEEGQALLYGIDLETLRAAKAAHDGEVPEYLTRRGLNNRRQAELVFGPVDSLIRLMGWLHALRENRSRH